MPGLYDVEYADTRAGAGWVTRFTPRDGAPARVVRRFVADLSKVPTSRVIESPEAQFGDLFLTEVARGCLWGCRFCAAGFVQRPYREVDLETLRAEVKKGIAAGQRVGLVGPDTSDYSGLDPLTCFIGDQGGTFSPSSLRVDAITPLLAGRMAAGGERSITLAPEAGTPRLREVINKDFSDDRIVQAAADALASGMQHVKLYFMCGLPTETEEDVLGMARFAVRIREEVMAPRAKVTKRMGRITLSVNPFVPKPWTPFQWQPMHDRKCLEGKRKLLTRELRPLGIEVDFMSPREAALQALFSRGDRRCADLLELAHREFEGDLGRALRRWPHDPDFFVLPRDAGGGAAALGLHRPRPHQGLPGARAAAWPLGPHHPQVRGRDLPGLRARLRRPPGAQDRCGGLSGPAAGRLGKARRAAHHGPARRRGLAYRLLPQTPMVVFTVWPWPVLVLVVVSEPVTVPQMRGSRGGCRR